MTDKAIEEMEKEKNYLQLLEKSFFEILEHKEYIFKGKFLSKDQFKIAEICFNTSMTGYQEILTDPSYKSQFINFTFPLIGIVGCNNEDYESWKIHASGSVSYTHLRAHET